MTRRLKKSRFIVGMVKAARELPADLRRARSAYARKSIAERYLRDHLVAKLQIGSGANLLSGWLNSDYMPRQSEQLYLDATQPFPFPSQRFDYIFSEHVIEHLWYRDGLAMLRESYRVLKPGGRIRISTPNLRQIVSLLDEPLDEIRRRYVKLATDEHIPDNKEYRPSFVVNNFFWDFGHLFVYDPQTLARSLELAGFQAIREWPTGESDDPQLRGIESHGKIIGDDMNQFETMVLEGTKA
jgi:predicted SAM-dependent methyltransferase